MLKKIVLPLTLTVALFGVSTAVFSEDSPEETAIEYRQGAFTITKVHFGQMGAMVKGEKEFNADEFKKNAAVVAQMSQLVINGFIPGSDKGDTKAKPNVWSDADGFKSKLETFQTEAAALVKAAESGDMAQIKPQFGKVAESCKACHKEYREE